MAPSAAADRGIWVVPALLRPAPVPQVPDPGAGGCVQLQGATVLWGVCVSVKANSCNPRAMYFAKMNGKLYDSW